MASKASSINDLDWKITDINLEKSVRHVKWDGLMTYAIHAKSQLDGHDSPPNCKFAPEYSMGGRNVVRRLDFSDGTSWVARVQQGNPSPESIRRLQSEVYTMEIVGQQSEIPVPKVYAHEATSDNDAAAPFILMEFIPGSTAMDSFGGHAEHGGRTPAQFRPKFHAALADIQVQMSSIRFPQIGAITKMSDGTFTIGPMPRIGGPFDTAAEFFIAWAEKTKYPYQEAFIRERTPADVVEELIKSINAFPSRVRKLAQSFPFNEGPFPIFHTDFYCSNKIIDSEHNVLSIIDWEDAIVAPWEIVEITKELSSVPRVMDGSYYQDTCERRQVLEDCKKYAESAKIAEVARGIDDRLSAILADSDMRDFAHAIWLYEDGRIGFYGDVADQVERRIIPGNS